MQPFQDDLREGSRRQSEKDDFEALFQKNFKKHLLRSDLEL